jgi:ubiquinone/menaquinone biosynthesis C-methylase UbiE
VNEQSIRFTDGAAYERMMGKWSHLVGDAFLHWLHPGGGLKWIDVGCGNGAFTELVVERCAPASVEGIDPAEAQLTFARDRHTRGFARFQQGDAQSLPFAEATFDVAVMALVIPFVPEPPRGVAEMVRVVRPGGWVAAYIWDLPGGGYPLEPILQEMQAVGLPLPLPPHPGVSTSSALRNLWSDAGLKNVEVQRIPVTRTFESFDDYWSACMAGSTGQVIAKLSSDDAAKLKGRVKARLAAPDTGALVVAAHANAVKGQVR